ncbi:hypothetical protein GP486_000007 [Trichoglossum hirsutum]|uniref:Uncharacterized protein n=1 Tax=Trichoglossum hirsutum TaxID=265104 RepID=A0A9P8LJM1_9PEZI|nr:hypothetical protein GP486_000007 [Trichoglossum hirsutum]
MLARASEFRVSMAHITDYGQRLKFDAGEQAPARRVTGDDQEGVKGSRQLASSAVAALQYELLVYRLQSKGISAA